MGDPLTYAKPKESEIATLRCSRSPGDETVVLPSVFMSRMMDTVRTIFSDPSNIYHPQIRGMIFDPDPVKTKVTVMTGFPSTPESEQADVYPRVVVLSGETWFGELDPVTGGNFTNTFSPPGEIFGTEDGMSTHSGNATFSCVSRNPLESLLMAESIAVYFIVYRNSIREDLRLSSFDVRTIKGPTPAAGSESVHETVVQVRWSSGMTWSIVEDGPALADTGM